MQRNTVININLLVQVLAFIFLTACNKQQPLNDPYPPESKNAVTYYSSFTEQPKTLDPARSYSSNEAIFTAQIYEPPLQYHYLKRPYTLIPLTATTLPQLIYLDKNNKMLPSNTPVKNIVYSVYEVHIKPGIYYQPHPAFARQDDGSYYYRQLNKADLHNIFTLSDFKHTGTRELVAEDYSYQIKRLANPRVQSPIFGFLNRYLVDFPEFNERLKKQYAESKNAFIDLRDVPLLGVEVVDRYTYRIKLKGYYPQFMYWLAMPFFAPMPWEADMFYSQPELKERNITLDWYPVGTGAFMLQENNPNRRMVLVRNPNVHDERYPDEGEQQDRQNGLLNATERPMPFIDEAVFTLEKESIPRWAKFLQGYYDMSGIGSDNFDQAVAINAQGQPEATATLREKNIHLQTEVMLGVFYLGFNMLDPVVGGDNERSRKLRQALAIAVDYEEYIAIFLNGRGIPAQGPVSPGIFGYRSGQAGMNPYIYQWQQGRAVRKDITVAKKLLQEAGYPNGYDAKTKKQLLLNFDVMSGGSGDDAAMFAWMREQFAKLGIELRIRDTQYNRFQEKVRSGQAQIFFWGWQADYPDPENFLFLLYGPNGKVKFDGENATNYHNEAYDQLFNQMRNLPNGAERQAIIDKMVAIVQRDTPWVWGFHPQSFGLSQSWVAPTKPNGIANNTLKYIQLDPKLRLEKQWQWNPPIWWPLWGLLLILVISFIPISFYYWRKLHKTS